MANSISGKDGKREMICSFCGRSQSQVDQLIIGPGVNICKDCIDMCYSALYKDGNAPEPPRATPERRAAASRGHSGVDPLADVNIMTPAEIKAGLDQYVIGQDEAKKALIQQAVQPFYNPDIRDYIENVRRSHEQVIDSVNIDTVLFAGYDTDKQANADRILKTFHAFIEENKDEILALRIIYDQRYKDRPMAITKLKALYEKLKAQNACGNAMPSGSRKSYGAAPWRSLRT